MSDNGSTTDDEGRPYTVQQSLNIIVDTLDDLEAYVSSLDHKLHLICQKLDIEVVDQSDDESDIDD